MKASMYSFLLAASLISSNSVVLASGNPGDLVITNLTQSGNQGMISWTGGRPTYQIQTRLNLTASWMNLGAPITNNFAIVPASEDQAFFRVVSDFTARYQVVFDATWSQATLPTNWPANAHFSGLVGGTHNANVHFWNDGETASEGIRLMAE